MHLILSALHILIYFDFGEKLRNARQMIQTVFVLGEILNFCSMCTLYSSAPEVLTMTDKQKAFHGWVYIEAFAIAMTIVNLILHLLLRNIQRPYITFDLNDET